MTIKIAVLDDYQSVASNLKEWNKLSEAEVTFFNHGFVDESAMVSALFPYDVLVTIRERSSLPASLIEQLSNLKLIAGTGRRQNHVDLQSAKANGITVTGTHFGQEEPIKNSDSGVATAELTWGLILDISRKITWENNALRNGIWQSSVSEGLAGKTLGIMGLGRIGSIVASFGNIFGMKVIAWGPTLTKQRADKNRVELVLWEELFQDSDFLTIHVLLTKLSRHWVGSSELSLMKPTAYIINTARAGIIDSSALIDSLSTQRISGGAFDVFDEEPINISHPLLKLNNVITTPHLGYATRETLTDFLVQAIDCVKKWIEGKPINVVN